MTLTNLPDFSAFCPSIQLSLNVSAFALCLFPFFLQTCTLRKGRTIIISSWSDIFCIRYLKSMTITDHREVKQKWMTWACPLRSSYIKINYTHNSLGVSVTIRSYRQFSPVKLEVGIWSWVTFCKQKCVVGYDRVKSPPKVAKVRDNMELILKIINTTSWSL